MKSKKKQLLKNSGMAIDHFRNLKNMDFATLAKKSKIKSSAINDICTGKKSPTKEQIKSICKAMNVPKEAILLYSITEKDVAPRKRELFNELMPSIKGLMESIIKPDKKLTKKQVVDKSVKIITAHKKFKTKNK